MSWKTEYWKIVLKIPSWCGWEPWDCSAHRRGSGEPHEWVQIPERGVRKCPGLFPVVSRRQAGPSEVQEAVSGYHKLWGWPGPGTSCPEGLWRVHPQIYSESLWTWAWAAWMCWVALLEQGLHKVTSEVPTNLSHSLETENTNPTLGNVFNCFLQSVISKSF